MIDVVFSTLARAYAAAQAKPIATASAGASTGLVAWLINWVEAFTKFFQLAAGFFGALAAALAVLFLLPRFIRFVRAWRKRGLAAADLE